MTRPKTKRTTRTKRTARARAAFTLIEVMMAISIMTVGSVGILALHQATTRGNVDAHQTSAATEIARTWIERVRRDALRWNAPGKTATTGTLLASVPVSPTADGVWVPAISPISSESFAFDYRGIDTTPSSTNRPPHFCVDIRNRWIIGTEAIRVDVRVWWHRNTTDTDRNAFTCDGDQSTTDAVTADLDATIPKLHAVYGSTVVRWTRLGT